MRRIGSLLVAFLLVVALSDGVHAAKKRGNPAEPEQPPLPPAVHDWGGFYAGVNAGIAWGSFSPVTSTVVDGTIGSLTVPAFNAAGHQAGNPFGFGGGAHGPATIGNGAIGSPASKATSSICT